MGYYTKYELEAYPSMENEIEEAIDENENLSYALSGYECKWYDHEQDMRNFSKKFPYTVFKLIGEGEEAGDLWIKYFKNGKMQYCPAIITFVEYDESLLG